MDCTNSKELKSSEEIHNNIDAYYQSLQGAGEIIIIKHEDKITIDVKDGEYKGKYNEYDKKQMHDKVDLFLNTMKYGEIRIVKDNDKCAINAFNRNRRYIKQ